MIKGRAVSTAETRVVSATWGQLAGQANTSVVEARKKILQWVSRRSDEALPATAKDGEPFTLALGSGEVIASNGLWALRFDTSDDVLRTEEGIERRWRTEAVLATLPGQERAFFTLRLSVVTAVAGVPFFRSAPVLIRELSELPGLIFDGQSATTPIPLTDADAFIRLLIQRDRRPILAIAQDDAGKTHVDGDWLSKQNLGFAHVVQISEEVSWALTKKLGRHWSVYNGAIRVYMPGVDLDKQEHRAHPTWLKEAIPNEASERKKFQRRIHERLLGVSVARADLDDIAPGFSSINAHLKSAQLSAASKAASEARALVTSAKSDQEIELARLREIEALKLERVSLEEEISAQGESIREISQDRDLAYETNREYEEEIDRMKVLVFSLAAKSRSLEVRLSERGVNILEQMQLPSSFEEMQEWAERYFPDRLVVLPKAMRAAKKATYPDVEHIYRCLILLAVEYVDMRLGVEQSSEKYKRKCEELRVEVSPVGDAVDDRRYREQFTAPYKTGYSEMDMHLAPMMGTSERGSRDPAKTYRIYFFWDHEQGVVVVGSLPSHLTTSLTH